MLHPSEVGIAFGQNAILPTLIICEPLAVPVRDVEGRVGKDEMCLEVGVTFVVEAVALGDLATIDAADCEVHLGQTPGCVVGLLAPDRNVAARLAPVDIAGRMRPDEFNRLHKHAGRAATRDVDPAPIGLQHLDQQPDDATRRVELAALLAFRTSEPGQKVLAHAAKHVQRTGLCITHPDITDHVDELPEALLVEGMAGIVLSENVFESGVVMLNREHCFIDDLADIGLFCSCS